MITNDHFDIIECSPNIFEYLRIPLIDNDIIHSREALNEKLNMKTIIKGFEDLMAETLGNNYIPPAFNHNLVNSYCAVNTYDDKAEDFKGSIFFCILSYI